MATADAPLMLGVSGMRGLVDRSLTPAVVARVAAAVGGWLREQQPESDASVHVVIGRDSRPSGASYEDAAASGLAWAGCTATRVGILSTPGVAIMIDHCGADAGLVITASHNPIE